MNVLEPVGHEARGLPPGLADDLAAASLALARRLHAGGSLWCASPAWPHHAQHLAVEFVHPVIVGKPAVPAVALASSGMVAMARANARSGDALVVIGPPDDPLVRDLVRRAPAWGLIVIWIGAGARPEAGGADHLLWLPDDGTAAHDGRFILLYHLLWELVHVCLEHRDLLDPPSGPEPPICATCSDEGRLAEVVTVAGRTGQVRTADGLEDVDLALIEDARPHDLILVHAGTAISRLPSRP